MLERASDGRRDLAILDCGCGTGFNLRILAPFGHVHGMDLTVSGLEFAKASGRPLVRADARWMPYRANTFDLVTSFDLLQCVRDDIAVVRELARVLKPGGHVVLTVAALPRLHGDHSVLSREVRRYTLDMIHRLLWGAGMQPVHVAYAFATMLPLVFGVRAAQRLWRGHSAESEWEITIPPAPVNAALSALIAGEAALARYMALPFGSSLVALARKNPAN
jgi:ubiquinone/menaquinone biosynthesis C-methylase UbiE